MAKCKESIVDDLVFVAFVTLVLMTTVRIASKNIDFSYFYTTVLASTVLENSEKTQFSGL